MKEALLTLHPMIQIFHCKISSLCYNNLVKTIKFLFFLILFLSSSILFAQSTYRQKTFETFTIKFDTQKPFLSITNTQDKTLVLKDYLNDDTKKEKPKSLAEKNLKKRTADDYTYVDCIKIIDMHGNLQDLETIYNSINSLEDCYNFSLKKMGFEYSSASYISKDPKTGEITHRWDLIIGKLEWDDE